MSSNDSLSSFLFSENKSEIDVFEFSEKSEILDDLLHSDSSLILSTSSSSILGSEEMEIENETRDDMEVSLLFTSDDNQTVILSTEETEKKTFIYNNLKSVLDSIQSQISLKQENSDIHIQLLKKHSSKHKRFFYLFKCIQLITELLTTETYATKRDLFYRQVDLFQKQSNFDSSLELILDWLNSKYWQVIHKYDLNVLISGKALISGDFSVNLTKDSQIIHYTKYSIQGNLLPQVEHILSFNFQGSINADGSNLILIIEKASTFTYLISNCYSFKNMLFLVASKGFADEQLKLFLVKIILHLNSFKVHLLGLFDCDPYGIHILLDMNRFLSSKECSKTVEMVGVYSSDRLVFGIPDDCYMDLELADYKRGLYLLLNYQVDTTTFNEIQRQMFSWKKCEIQSLIDQTEFSKCPLEPYLNKKLSKWYP